ncbi:MAG: peptidoglycan endopeptidase [Alphaproteobacteria bacterium]|nr:MAG: peptidoglycan endopeptidase [Alphaproteobacteria bacterium]
MRLSMGALLHVPDPTPQAGFIATDAGWLPATALAPLSAPAADWVGAAEALLGVPYLWGGNSADGIDCSGLVQLARLAAGCADPGPRDSDQQWRHWGRPWPGGAEPLERGTLAFWRGHVAIVTGPGALIHANAHHMAVAREPLDAALARIAATDGPPLGIGRPDAPDAG